MDNSGAPAQGGAPPQGGQGGDWMSGEGWDDGLRGAMAAKGYSNPAALAKAYISLNKHLGADERTLVRLPRSESDTEAWRDVYRRLGAPEKPDEYELPEPAQGGTDMREWFKGVAHELGITKKQAKVLAEKFGGYLGEQTKANGASKSGDLELARRRIQEKWGQEHDANMDHAQRAVTKFGWNDEVLAELRDGGPAGAERALELLAYIGRNIREDGLPGPQNGNPHPQPFGGTPSANRARFADITNDKAFMDRVMRRDPAAVAEFRKLSELAYPEGSGMTAGGPPRT